MPGNLIHIGRFYVKYIKPNPLGRFFFLCFHFKERLSKTSRLIPIHLHVEDYADVLKWNERLKIAVDAAYGNVHFLVCFLLIIPCTLN